MKTVIRQIVEYLGRHHDAAEHTVCSEFDLATTLEVGTDHIHIALGMMGEQGLLAREDHDGKPVLALSEKGLTEYRSYLDDD
jgi:hypothetical protein